MCPPFIAVEEGISIMISVISLACCNKTFYLLWKHEVGWQLRQDI